MAALRASLVAFVGAEVRRASFPLLSLTPLTVFTAAPFALASSRVAAASEAAEKVVLGLP